MLSQTPKIYIFFTNMLYADDLKAKYGQTLKDQIVLVLHNLFQSPGGKWNLANSGHVLTVTLTANSFKDGRPISFWPNEPETEAKSSCFVKEACGHLVPWVWPLLSTFVTHPHFGVFSEPLPAVPGVSGFQAILALVGLVSNSLLAVTSLRGFVLTTLLAQTLPPPSTKC